MSIQYIKKIDDFARFTNEDLCGLVNRFNGSQLVRLQFGSTSTSVRCQMGDFGCGDGGWTPVMKIDGNKVLQYQVSISC